jgi:hypothetical protein
MKTFLFALALTASLSPDCFARHRNCTPEDRMPGRRCADQWAAQEDVAERAPHATESQWSGNRNERNKSNEVQASELMLSD